MKIFDQGQPTIRSRACVIHSDLELRFLSKEQRNLFIHDLIADELSFDFQVETNPGDSLTLAVYTVTINDISWANNLMRIAELADKYDYNGGCED